jgi:hypothetical protein
MEDPRNGRFTDQKYYQPTIVMRMLQLADEPLRHWNSELPVSVDSLIISGLNNEKVIFVCSLLHPVQDFEFCLDTPLQT